MNRRAFLKASGAAIGSLTIAPALVGKAFAQATNPATADKPDVLFIAIEDVSPHRFGCWGGIAKTPNIDRLASQSLRFDLAHTMCPPCNPSRTSLFLGLRPETTTVYSNTDDWRQKWSERVTMPQHFANSGYETARVGKMYHSEFEHDASWTKILDYGRVSRKTPAVGPGMKYGGKNNPGDAKNPDGTPSKQPAGAPFLYGPSGLDDLKDQAGLAATKAIEELAVAHDKPLFLAVGLQNTHLPFSAPDKYYAMYKPEDMVVPQDIEEDIKDIPDTPDLADHNDMTLREKQEAIAGHLASLSYVDSQVGRIIEGLEKSGRADKTIVVLWSDHGFLLGEHGQWRKGALYDEGVMVALLMKAPGLTQPGSVCKRPVESVDIFPTLFDLCNLPPYVGPIEGVSMRPILQDPQAEWKPGAVTRNGRSNRSIRTERWRYSEYGNGTDKAELYDHTNDPKELTNVANDPANAETVKELSALLNADWTKRLPAGVQVTPNMLQKAAPSAASAPASAPVAGRPGRQRRNRAKNAEAAE